MYRPLYYHYYFAIRYRERALYGFIRGYGEYLEADDELRRVHSRRAFAHLSSRSRPSCAFARSAIDVTAITAESVVARNACTYASRRPINHFLRDTS